jgi:MoxR-like ATPase
MNEGQVSIEGITYKLPEPFLVIATQNPVEFHGTYPLPEAQLDRFLMKIHIGYPDKDHEIEILYGQNFSHPVDSLKPVIDLNELILIQKEVKNVKVDRSLAGYITDIIEKTRNYPQLDLGASPRGSLMLFRTSQANALISNRNYVIPDDVKSSAVRVLSHRTMLNTKAKYSGIKKEDIILEIINSVKVPD